MGRKKKTTPTKKTWIVVRATPDELAAVKEAARGAGVNLSAYVLQRCLPEAQPQATGGAEGTGTAPT